MLRPKIQHSCPLSSLVCVERLICLYVWVLITRGEESFSQSLFPVAASFGISSFFVCACVSPSMIVSFVKSGLLFSSPRSVFPLPLMICVFRPQSFPDERGRQSAFQKEERNPKIPSPSYTGRPKSEECASYLFQRLYNPSLSICWIWYIV